MVTIQETMISRSMRRLSALRPRFSPTPRTAPTRAWVEEIGSPSFEAKRIVIAAPNSAENPRVGVSSVIFFPIVSMTRQGYIDAIPIAAFIMMRAMSTRNDDPAAA